MANEKAIVDSCTKRLADSDLSGVVIHLYEFPNDAKAFKAGYMFHANKLEHIKFGEGVGGNAKGSFAGQKTCTRFSVGDNCEQQPLHSVMRQGSRLKHIGIVKPLFVAYNEQLKKTVFGFGSFDQLFAEWLAHQAKDSIANRRQRGQYLSATEKELLITACTSIAEMWKKGYWCDHLKQPSTYVMIGQRIKILPNFIRTRDTADNDMMIMRNDLADMFHQYILPLWPGIELEDFISLVRNPKASIEALLGHPILLSPERRQLMYRSYNARGLTVHQLLESQNLFSEQWKITLPQENEVLWKICKDHPFPPTFSGAMQFAAMVSRHYVENFKRLNMRDWYMLIREDTVDKLLKETVTGLLSKRYNLEFF